MIGLREGAMVLVESGNASLLGTAGARLFRKNTQSVELTIGAKVDGFVQPLPG